MSPSDTDRTAFAAYRLPAGRHGLPPELVAENQRWRLLGAAAEVLAERGYAHTKAAEIARCAGVSRSTFYQHFANVDACLLAAYEMAADCACDLVSEVCEQGGGEEWPTRLRMALDQALAFFAAEPSIAALLGAAAPAGNAATATARDRLLDRLARTLRSGRKLRGDGAPELPPDTERRLLAGAFGLIAARVSAGEAERLPELATELTAILIAPYLGVTGGRRLTGT